LGDSFWSAATGRYILEHGGLPTRDPFSFTASREWIVHMPGSQILLGWVSQHFGVLALELFGALVFAASLLTLWLPHTLSALARQAVFPLLALLIFLQQDDLCVRGQIFGDLAFALLLLCCFKLRLGQRVHPALGLLLGCVWINLHSSAFLAVLLPLAWAGLLRLQAADRRPPLRPFLWFAAAAALGLLLNPYGWRLVFDLLRLMMSAGTRRIDLFLPPDFGSPWVLLAFAVLGTSALWCFRRPTPSSGVGLAEGLLILLLAIAAVSGRRYLPLALAFSIVVVARQISAAFTSVALDAGRASSAAFASVALGAAFWGLSADKDPWQNVPLEEARLVEMLALPDHVAHSYHWGGFLDYVWYGRRKVFVDGRNQLFEGGAFEDHSRLARLEGWREVLDRYRINTVIWERDSPLDAALAQSGEWTQLRRGPIAVLYVRKQRILPSVPR